MRLRTQKNHMIDFLFPLGLFLVFTISALTVILLATNIYSSATEHSTRNYTAGTSLSYIAEKIHQNDENGTVSIGTFDGREALILEQNYNQTSYFTYIYADGTKLKELFVKDGVSATAASGKTILEIKALSMEAINDHAFRFTCTDQNNQSTSTIVSFQSSK